MTLDTCVLNNFKTNSDEPEEIVEPWLQILKALINVLEREALKGLEKLIIDQMQCRRTAKIKSLLIQCAENLILRLNGDLVIWPLFYEDALNSIKLNQCFQESHSLIRTLMKLGLHKDLEVLLILYTNKRMKASEASIRTLSEALKLKPQSSDTRLILLQWLSDQVNIDSLGTFK